MKRENVILTGFMGTGKSTVGKRLAEILGYRFVDTDQLIEERTGQSIAELFRLQGEAVFRKWETIVSRELAHETGAVIATGGRLMLDPDNARCLGSSGPIFCLAASSGEVARRLKEEGSERPLLAVPDPESRIQELLAARAADYAQFTQVVTENRSVNEVARKIQMLMYQRSIDVKHPGGSYNVHVAPGILTTFRELAEVDGPIAIISDSNVGKFYADRLSGDILVTMPAGEENKTLATVNEIYSQLIAAGLDRQGTIVALGGGVVGDVAGYVAATYMRGIAFVQCPTSLLAMVDASVGGKTGVDLPEGKNLVGVFKQPKSVIADLETLSTLPDVEFSAGMAEVIKAGLIADRELFYLVEAQANRLMARSSDDIQLLQKLVGDAVEVKRKIVEADPYEMGRRAVLNLGHTFGHAVEQVSGYEVRHGDGVAMGLVASAHLSAELGHCAMELEPRICGLLDDFGLPIQIPSQYKAEAVYEAMGSDKKKVTGRLRFVLPRDIGDVFVSERVTREQVLSVLHYCGAS